MKFARPASLLATSHCSLKNLFSRRQFLRTGSIGSLGLGAYLLAGVSSAAAEGSQTLVVAEAPVGELRYGIGFNWYDGFQNENDSEGNPSHPNLDDEAGWAAVYHALNELRPGIIRFGLPPDSLVGEQPGQIDTHDVYLQKLARVAGWAGKNGCTVLLDPFSVPKKFQFPMGPREQELKKKKEQYLDMAARDNDVYARDYIVPLLRNVLVERNLRAVKLFNAYNEPLMYGPFTTPGNHPDAFVHYVDMYKAIHSELGKAGFYPEKIGLAGVDCIQPSSFPELDFVTRGVDINPYLEVYTIHYYFNRFDWTDPVPFLGDNMEESMDRQTPKLVDYCRRRGKPLLASELGWYSDENDADPLAQQRHHAALVTAEIMVRGMNAGLSGFAIWCLIDAGWWRVVWVSHGSLYKSEHLYPMYRLFSRYARPGSQVFPMNPDPRTWPWQYVYSTALVTPEGKGVLYAINDHPIASRKMRFVLPRNWAGRRLTKVIKDNERLGTEAGTVQSKESGSNSVIEDLLTPSSLTAYLEEV